MLPEICRLPRWWHAGRESWTRRCSTPALRYEGWVRCEARSESCPLAAIDAECLITFADGRLNHNPVATHVACFVAGKVNQLLLQHFAAALDEGNAAQGAGGARPDAGAIGNLGGGGDTHPAAGGTDLNPAAAGARKGANSDNGQSSSHGFQIGRA